MQWDRKSHLETALQRHPVKRRERGALLGFFTTTEPKKRWGRKKDTSQWGFKSMPLMASQHRNRELKKKKKNNPSKPTERTWLECHHLHPTSWSSISAEAPALKHSWPETLNPTKTTYQIWAETGTQQDTKHKRDTVEHRSRFSSLSSFKGQEQLLWGQFYRETAAGALTAVLHGHISSTE